MVKNLPAVADPGSILGSGRSPGEGNSYPLQYGNSCPLQYSCLENSMDREEPGGLQSMGSRRVGHDWVTNTFTFFWWARIPHASQTKKKKKTKPENRNNIAINSIKTLKMIHIKNLFKNNKQCLFLMCPTCSPWEACFPLFICNLSFPSCQHLQHSPGVSFIEFNKHSAWPSQHCPSFPTACHVNLVLCKWLLYSSPLSLKDD